MFTMKFTMKIRINGKVIEKVRGKVRGKVNHRKMFCLKRKRPLDFSFFCGKVKLFNEINHCSSSLLIDEFVLTIG